ncbi:GNAT family N-acetyltransferase [uncultured Cellulomonas sp.]|uniref:GNAT family N-acetyltransferase n=1 Tax=uncultured Cellulomonas sp. TaxID=189682 RepID=UPI002612C60F|nr:GNAT family protein [uncultured Cellulomonas sp.]
MSGRHAAPDRSEPPDGVPDRPLDGVPGPQGRAGRPGGGPSCDAGAPVAGGPAAQWRPARLPGGRVLTVGDVRLRPLVADDAPALFAALDEPRVWAAGYAGGRRPLTAGDMTGFVDRLLTRPDHAAFAVEVLPDGDPAEAWLVGTSSLGDARPAEGRVYLGWTAYSPAVWGTRVNPAAKLALLGHAFDDCGFHRVKIQTDVRNERSQAAIARLGATREGVLRGHQPRADGSWRDTVVFSILVDEWPAVRAGLEERLRTGR